MPFVIYGAPGEIQTPDIRCRRPLFYSLNYRRFKSMVSQDGFQPSIKWCNGWGTIPQWRFLSLAYVYGGKSRTRTDTLRIMSSQYIHYTIFPVSVIAIFLYPQPLLHVGVILSLRAPNCLPVNVKLTWQMQHSNS